MRLESIVDAVRTNCVLDPKRRWKLFCHAEYEDSPDLGQRLLIGISNQEGISAEEVCQYLGIEQQEYANKLVTFRSNLDLAAVAINPSASLKRFITKYELCMNYLNHTARSKPAHKRFADLLTQ